MKARSNLCASHTESYNKPRLCKCTRALHLITENLDHEPTRLQRYLPRVKLMNDALEANNCEKSRAESCQPGQKENSERQQRLPSRRLRQSAGQASAATSSRRVGPPVARDRTPGVGARFVLTIGGGVVLRHVLSEPCGRICFRKALPTATHPSVHQPTPSSAPISQGLGFKCRSLFAV